MLFYDCATAPSPRRARMAIAEKGMEVETREISLKEGAQLSADFLAVNPRATVPVLVTDAGTVLTENTAIASYLEDVKPEPPLFGSSPDDRALVWMWTSICESQGGMAVAEALRNGNPHMKGRALTGPQNYEQIPELAKRGLARVGHFKDMLDRHLADREWIALDRFSYADITGFVFCDFARVVRMGVTDDHPNLKRWFDRVAARPSAGL